VRLCLARVGEVPNGASPVFPHEVEVIVQGRVQLVRHREHTLCFLDQGVQLALVREGGRGWRVECCVLWVVCEYIRGVYV
jgi:hypothetical protein